MFFRCIYFKKKNNVYEKKFVVKLFYLVFNDIIFFLMMFILYLICLFDSVIFLRVCCKVCIFIF